MSSDIFQMFMRGALSLGTHMTKYSNRHAQAGFSKSEWNLLTQADYWTADQARQIPTLLSEAVSLSLSIAGIPAVPLPAHYMAAVISVMVHPCNRNVAAIRAPRSFDAIKASGFDGPVEVVDATREQLLGLVILYSSDEFSHEPSYIDRRVADVVRAELAAQKEKSEKAEVKADAQIQSRRQNAQNWPYWPYKRPPAVPFAAGETMDMSVAGSVELSALREQASVYLNARLDVYAQPARWFDEFFSSGLSASAQIDMHTAVSGYKGLNLETESVPQHVAPELGLGSGIRSSVRIYRFWRHATERIYNEYYKWPEDPDLSSISHWAQNNTPKMVNLPKSYTRGRTKNYGEREATLNLNQSSPFIDIRELSETQAEFRRAIETGYLTHGRYIAMLKELYGKGAGGSRDVDKVPLHIGEMTLGVTPSNFYATDGDSLGQKVSFHNFDVGHTFDRFVAPEHMIVTLVLGLRFNPVSGDHMNPFYGPANGTMDVEDMRGDPGLLAAKGPQHVQHSQIFGGGNNSMGYLPAGWQWRDGFDNIDRTIRDRGTFPLLLNNTTTLAQARDASRIENCFQSTALGHYIVDINQRIIVDSPVPGPKASLFAGAPGAGRGSAYPYPQESVVK